MSCQICQKNDFKGILKKNMDTYKILIETAIKNAEAGVSKLTDDVLQMSDFSGEKNRHFYNNLMDSPDARCLEIGNWRGSSVCAAMCGNAATVWCIDNWSGKAAIKAEFMSNVTKYIGNNNVHILDQDCCSVDPHTLPKFNIYLHDVNEIADGFHKTLAHFYDSLDDVFILVVDDWNWKAVQQETKKSIQDLQLLVLYEHEIQLTTDNSHTPFDIATKSWWNGMYVAILRKHGHNASVAHKKYSADRGIVQFTPPFGFFHRDRQHYYAR